MDGYVKPLAGDSLVLGYSSSGPGFGSGWTASDSDVSLPSGVNSYNSITMGYGPIVRGSDLGYTGTLTGPSGVSVSITAASTMADGTLNLNGGTWTFNAGVTIGADSTSGDNAGTITSGTLNIGAGTSYLYDALFNTTVIVQSGASVALGIVTYNSTSGSFTLQSGSSANIASLVSSNVPAFTSYKSGTTYSQSLYVQSGATFDVQNDFTVGSYVYDAGTTEIFAGHTLFITGYSTSGAAVYDTGTVQMDTSSSLGGSTLLIGSSTTLRDIRRARGVAGGVRCWWLIERSKS